MNNPEYSLETVESIERVGEEFHIHFENGGVYVCSESEFDTFSKTGKFSAQTVAPGEEKESSEPKEASTAAIFVLSGIGCLISLVVLLTIFSTILLIL